VHELLNRKLRKMYAALADLSTDNLSAIQPIIIRAFGYRYTEVDFNQQSNEVDLENAVTLLLTNIASLKDHLKKWCKDQGVPFRGDALLNANRSAALVHDLWNLDKHAELNSKPRSGIVPRVQNIRTVLELGSGTSAGGGAFFTMDPRTGTVTHGASGGGSVRLALCAEIVDEAGAIVADFTQTCEEAIDAWLGVFREAGLRLS